MKKKMSDRDKKILYFLGAIAVVALVYFFVFTKFNEKKSVLASENAQLQEEVTRLANMEAQKQTVIDETLQLKDAIGKRLQEFPSEVRTQNAIYDLYQMQEQIKDVEVQSQSYTMNELFFQPSTGVDANGNPIVSDTTTQNASVSAVTQDTPVNEVVSAAAGYTGYRSNINVVFTSTYDALKDVIDYINNEEDRMTITSISATAAEDANASDLLSCNMTVSMYAISGTGEEYKEPDVAQSGKVGRLFGK